ncbi:MAG: PilC/PilY family type IV pilus protein [bacterium]
MRTKLYIFLICSMVTLNMIVFPEVSAWPASVEIRVASSIDDAVERLSDGSVYLGSPYLDMACSDTEQIVGIRFQNVKVPRAVKITNAYIVFETGNKGNRPTNLIFRGEAVDNAHPFSHLTKDISKRPATTASVFWNNIYPWDTIGQKQQTSDLSAILQEIVDRPGWSAGNAMVFIITGSGKRSVIAFDGRENAAPLLHVEYQSGSIDVRVCQSVDDAEEHAGERVSLYDEDLNLVFTDPEQSAAGIRFQHVDVPRGALITTAYLSFESSNTGSEKTSMIITGEAGDDAPAFNNSMGNITNRTLTYSTVCWDHILPWDRVGEIHKTPDLSSIVQEIVGRSGWTRKNAMAFVIRGSGRRIAKSYDGKSTAGPVLHIEYTEANTSYITVDKYTLEKICYEGDDIKSDRFIINNTGSDTLRYAVSCDRDWFSCSSKSGRLTTGDSVIITLDYDIASLDVGDHEGTIKVTDPFAPNSPLEIDIRVGVKPLDKTAFAPCGRMPVYVKDTVDPAILILLDLSDSMQTLMPLSNDSMKNPRTPDLKGIVQEIVDRPGWKKGNAMAFIITGSGHRTAESYDGAPGSAPLLHLEYTWSGKPREADIRVSQSSDDAEEGQAGNMFLAGTDLELLNDMGAEQTIGIRFKDVPIPRNARITNAFLEFVPDEGQGGPTSLMIRGEALDNPPAFSQSARNISGRSLTNAYVNWNNLPEWTVPPIQSRIEIAKSVINTLITEKDIAWGYGTWCSRSSAGYTQDIDYTKILVGCEANDHDHQKRLRESIDQTSGNAFAGTPFANSLIAAKEYFLGQRKDKDGTGKSFMDLPCQPKFLISITDGLGSMGSTDTIIRQNVKGLCDIGVTPIAVDFGIDDATQISIIAQISNERGRSSKDLFVIHKEINGTGQPFLVYNKDDLIENLIKISAKIKSKTFFGLSPVLAASADYGDIFAITEFDSTDWSGDLAAYTYDNEGMEWSSLLWKASESIPVIRKVFTIDPSDSMRIISYTDSVLDNDNWLCKNIGDIIGSTPVIVGNPPFYYPFDGYERWKKDVTRDPLVYVGANDGALHTFLLSNGSEQWAFFPKSSHAKLNNANNPTFDQCSNDYCHQYYINGSPQVADIFTGGSWMTILVCGLREGGESYFALDVTHGKPFGETKGTRYLWEFTDSELGLSFSEPSIERIKNGTGTEWGAFFGSGYDTADQTDKEAYIYGIVAHNKAPLWHNGSNDINRIKMSPTDLKDDALSSPLIADLNADYLGDRIYVGNLYGTMYRVKNIGKGEHPKISKLFHFGHTSHINPIRAKAAYAYAVDAGSIWVYFGTGRYESQSDRVSGTQQYFFGLKEKIDDPNTYSLNNFARLYIKKMEYMDTETHETQYVKIIEGENDLKKSWALLLEASPVLKVSERVIVQPLVVAGKVFFSTFIPDRNICSGKGETWLYALEYETGLPPVTPVFDLNKDGVCNDKDMITDEQGKKHNIAGIYVGTGPGSKPVFHKDELFLTTTDKNLVALKVNLPESKAVVTSWRDCTI